MPRAAIPTLSWSPPAAGRAIDLPGSAGGARPRDRLLLGALVLAIGGVWIGVPLRALLGGAPPPLPGLGMAGSCALLAVGAGHLLWALDLLLRRRTLTVGASTLQVAVRSLTGVRRWREPLASYRGVRHRRERVYHRYGWRVVHRIELAHPDPGRIVGLLTTRNEGLAEAAARRWSEALGVPLLAAEMVAGRPPPREALRAESRVTAARGSDGDPGRAVLADEPSPSADPGRAVLADERLP
jgi:hypothetical protein